MKHRSNNSDHARLTRRAFLKGSALLAGAMAMDPPSITLGRSAARGEPSILRSAIQSVSGDQVLLGMYPRNQVISGEDAVALACQDLDFSWLFPGDHVFVKIQSNSANIHPAVTSPAAVRGCVRELFARGAGRVTVGDQAGVQSVRLAEGNQRYGSTRLVAQENGLLQAILESGADPYFFDEQDFEAGNFAGTPTFTDSHWAEPIYIPSIVREVDHIVYLPRISSHMIAGYSHGHKTAMGWLRDDSRYHVHHFADTLYEKFVEINYVKEIRDRHRLTLSLAESFMLDQGPDEGTVAEADPRVVVASAHLANHDAVATGMLTYIDGVTRKDPSVHTPYGPRANNYNFLLVSFGVTVGTGIPWSYESPGTYTPLEAHRYQAGIPSDRVLSRAYEIEGGIPSAIPVQTAGSEPSEELLVALDQYSDGIFVIS